jgi:signal transduction histidine kinase
MTQGYYLRAVLFEKEAEIKRLRALLREAIPFINDAGNDEDPEAQTRANDLFVRIARIPDGAYEDIWEGRAKNAEADNARLRAERDELKSEQIDLRLRITELELLVALKKITP